MSSVLIVGAGGFIGSALRYLVSIAFAGSGNLVPFSTIIVNLIGSFVMGAMIGLPLTRFDPRLQTLLIPGLLGGFTTFSAFSGEAILLLSRQEYFPAAIYISANLLGGFLLCSLGWWLAKTWS